MSEPLLLAIEIGGTKLQLVTARGTDDIIDTTRLRVDSSGDATGIQRQLASAIASLKQRFAWNAVGVGYGGPVDARTGTVCRSFQIGGWAGFPLADWLKDLVDAPVVVENDSNAAAFGEALAGSGKGHNPVFYTNSGSGVGGGLVVNGHLYHGAIPGEAEFGHLRLDREGTTVEDRCSGWAVDKKIRDSIASHPHSVLAKLARLQDDDGNESRLLSQALSQSDPQAQQLIEETAADLAFALSHVVHLFHPEVIVLGGGLALIGQPWCEAVARQLPQHLMEGFAPCIEQDGTHRGGPIVRLSSLGQQVVPIGVLHLASKQVGESSQEL